MKPRLFNVPYSVTTEYEAEVIAKTKKEAVAKVVEVVGKPVRIGYVYELPMGVLYHGDKKE